MSQILQQVERFGLYKAAQIFEIRFRPVIVYVLSHYFIRFSEAISANWTSVNPCQNDLWHPSYVYHLLCNT